MALDRIGSPVLFLPDADTSVAFVATSSSSDMANEQENNQSCSVHGLSLCQGCLWDVQVSGAVGERDSLTWAEFCSVIWLVPGLGFSLPDCSPGISYWAFWEPAHVACPD